MQTHGSKSEGRDPKAERRPRSEIRSLRLPGRFRFRVLGFGLLSDFGLRFSGFVSLLVCLLTITSTAFAQPRPYIGFVYPAGGQQGTTVHIRLGGQGLEDVNSVLVTGPGVSAKVAEYHRRLNNQEMQLLNEQLRVLRRETM